MLGAGMCRCSGPLRHRRAQEKKSDDTRAPASATRLGEVGAGSIEIPAFLGGGGLGKC